MESQRFTFALLMFAILIFIALPFLIFYTPAHVADIATPIVQTLVGLALKCRRSADKETIFRKDDEDSEEEIGATFPRAEEEEEEEDNHVSIGFGTYPQIFTYPLIPFHQTQRIIIPTVSSKNPRGYWYAIVLPLPIVMFLVATSSVLTLLVVSGPTMLR
ncbi:hypothetical protein ACE6H2_012485 [Prunus campanulata]